MSSGFDKPFKTYEEMIEILKSRNIHFKNEQKAIEDICDYSYYSLFNGYKTLFQRTGDCFVEQIAFDQFKYLSLIDNNLNSIILKYIIYVEKSLKSKISYIISKNYGVKTYIEKDPNLNRTDDYLCINNFQSSSKRNNVLKEIKNHIYKFSKKNNSIKYYISNHNHVPFWISINCLSFGDTIMLYSILKKDDKDYVTTNMIASSKITMDEKKDFIINALETLRQFRNDVAHGQRVFSHQNTSKLSKKTIMKLTNGTISNQRYVNELRYNRLFEVVLSLAVLLRNDTKELYISELKGFTDNTQHYIINNETITSLLGVPDDIIDILSIIK